MGLVKNQLIFGWVWFPGWYLSSEWSDHFEILVRALPNFPGLLSLKKL
jgi:hypothetical protein